jgi:hypothetical protein
MKDTILRSSDSETTTWPRTLPHLQPLLFIMTSLGKPIELDTITEQDVLTLLV